MYAYYQWPYENYLLPMTIWKLINFFFIIFPQPTMTTTSSSSSSSSSSMFSIIEVLRWIDASQGLTSSTLSKRSRFKTFIPSPSVLDGFHMEMKDTHSWEILCSSRFCSLRIIWLLGNAFPQGKCVQVPLGLCSFPLAAVNGCVALEMA